MMTRLGIPLNRERREEIWILVRVRWFLGLAAVFIVDYRHGTSTEDWLALNSLLGVALAINAYLHFSLSRGRSVPLWLPFAAGLYDLMAITGAIAAVDGFENQSFILYYPALLAFSLAFSGRPSWFVGGLAIALYTLAVATVHQDRVDFGQAADQKAYVLRVATMGAVVVATNLITNMGRRLREIAVTREARRLDQVHALREQARASERAAEEERRHLLREIHDGISQGVFMLSLGLESSARRAESSGTDSELTDRLDALARVAKGTLLETRGLLFDLNRVMAGEASVSELVRNQASEFQTVTGIAVHVDVHGAEVPLPASVVGELYRVLQESLSNVYRHAQATEARITVEYSPDTLAVEVVDNGVGFDQAGTNRRLGHGLRTMSERVESLGGAFAVNSREGEGTQLRLVIPRQELEE